MRSRIVVPALAITALVIGAAAMKPAWGTRAVEYTDFSKVATATEPSYNAILKPASDAPIKEYRIPIEDTKLQIADGVSYDGWSFGGTVPGPVLRVRQGD
ncbi:MAG TPA: hypothetical protein VG818_13230, partial [Gemmatimonadaceae bacterium]|nr:hypothetical protein [Gemmatimonadaceae bacterium]